MWVSGCAPDSAVDEMLADDDLPVAQRAPRDSATWLCGNGNLETGEACDDGNREPGDGCDTGCMNEAGFACDTHEPTRCKATCGDGLVRGEETCDDANDAAGDGCVTCQTESGYTCNALGGDSACTAICGDGMVILGAGELCDDGNAHPGDGCSATCSPEPGFCCDQEDGYCIQQDTFVVVDAATEIADGVYDGTLASMSCVEIEVTALGNCNYGRVQRNPSSNGALRFGGACEQSVDASTGVADDARRWMEQRC